MIAELRNDADRRVCPACGSAEFALRVAGLTDYTRRTPGNWNSIECRKCKTLRLYPLPTEEQLAGAYIDYQTHSSTAALTENGSAKETSEAAFRRKVAHQILRKRYGYNELKLSPNAFESLRFLHHRSSAEAEAEAEIAYLPAGRKGRLLDVGCGNGHRMRSLQHVGWIVEGCETDPLAREQAVRLGLNVWQGQVTDLGLPPQKFDAVVLFHVLEHVIDPAQTLAVLFELLIPGGTLVVATPNAQSWGARVFGRYWRGHEAPRHLQVFSSNGLRVVIEQSGFEVITNAKTVHYTQGIVAQSLAARFPRIPGFLARRFGLVCELAAGLQGREPRRGESLLMIAEKPT
jgi:2-polyprenyl-3-methyl-5-hydroxy-6-metoxy-1,4-benzoquinol methylase